MANVFILTKYPHLATKKRGAMNLTNVFGEKIATKLSYLNH
jgi:hypothetical protein